MEYSAAISDLGITGTLHGDELVCRCPLHQDSNPSFSINTRTGLWMCYSGCGQGDFVHLMMRVLDISYTEAFARSRNKKSLVGIDTLQRDLEEQFKYPELIEREPDYWVEYFHRLNSPTMAEWFLNRGFTWETIKDWNIKYEPITDAVLIPVYEGQTVVGIVVRYGRGLPKYVNSTGLEKSKVLFGRKFATSNTIMLVEGPLDAIWCWQNGIAAYSTLGAAVGPRQLQALRDQGIGEIVLGYDNDEPGRKATHDIAAMLLNTYLPHQIYEVKWPEGCKDAQDCKPDQLKTVYLEKTRYGFFQQ